MPFPDAACRSGSPVISSAFVASASANWRPPERVSNQVGVPGVPCGLIDHVRKEPTEIDRLLVERRQRRQRVHRRARCRGGRLSSHAATYKPRSSSALSLSAEWNDHSCASLSSTELLGTGSSRPSSLCWNHRSSANERCLTNRPIVRFVAGSGRACSSSGVRSDAWETTARRSSSRRSVRPRRSDDG